MGGWRIWGIKSAKIAVFSVHKSRIYAIYISPIKKMQRFWNSFVVTLTKTDALPLKVRLIRRDFGVKSAKILGAYTAYIECA